jgi:hypothetical protein
MLYVNIFSSVKYLVIAMRERATLYKRRRMSVKLQLFMI